MRDTVIVGNWKMNKTPKEVKAFMDEFKGLYESNKSKIESNVKFGFTAPAVSIQTLKDNEVKGMLLGAQNMHDLPNGAYTGELSVEMVLSVGSNTVLLGHSERRAMFNETSEEVAKKAIVAIKNGLTPIIAFGEVLEEREAGKHEEVVKDMVLKSIKGVDLSKVILAYEPVWAIGTGMTATAADAQDMCAFVRSITNKDVIIQYGGSVKPENVAELMGQEDIDGALVGGAALDPKVFIKLLTNNK
ncbi:MAG: triose-phosphate isomerase [Mycoplasmataceae bacterium]|nr:triose-phosphate isomerase [Mycoplasmataceae bacterium]